jgi:nitroreductase
MGMKEQIIRRKSIRKYDAEPLSNDVLHTIIEFVDKCEKPFSGSFCAKIVEKNTFFAETGGMFRIAAPHYLMFFGDKGNDDVLKNIGFAGELAILKLTEMGIGTCWLGGASSNEVLNDSEYVISICFGTPAEPFRGSEGEAERDTLENIARNCTPEQKDVLKYVRLAPSARNGQPWHFECETDEVHVFRKKQLVPISIFKMLRKIDIGIAVSHFCAAGSFEIAKKPRNMKGMDYECTLTRKG